VAVEPDGESFALLQQNLSRTTGTTAINGAVAGRSGHVRVVPVGESWANRVEQSDEGVPAMTMNALFDGVPKGEPFMAKVNIEGFESDLFEDNLDWLDRVTVLFIEPHDWLLPGKFTSRSFQRALGDRDFHLLIVGPNLCYVRL
jgi:FkbM family methyltransferase